MHALVSRLKGRFYLYKLENFKQFDPYIDSKINAKVHVFKNYPEFPFVDLEVEYEQACELLRIAQFNFKQSLN